MVRDRAVAAGRLCLPQGRIGIAQEFFDDQTMVGAMGDADAARHVELARTKRQLSKAGTQHRFGHRIRHRVVECILDHDQPGRRTELVEPST